MRASKSIDVQPIQIPVGSIHLHGDLLLPEGPRGIILFAHGSGSSRRSPRNRMVAGLLNEAGFGSLLLDLLTAEEEELDRWNAEYRFDIQRLASRLVEAVDWLSSSPETQKWPIGCFGASTGAAAALIAAAERPAKVRAVVSRGGRPDLAKEALSQVKSPTLLIVGELDDVVVSLNESALRSISAIKKMEIVSGATHLFEEPGALEQVSKLASAWFEKYLPSARKKG